MQISSYYHCSFLQKLIVFAVNEYENICTVGLNHRVGYAIEIKYPIIWKKKFPNILENFVV